MYSVFVGDQVGVARHKAIGSASGDRHFQAKQGIKEIGVIEEGNFEFGEGEFDHIVGVRNSTFFFIKL